MFFSLNIGGDTRFYVGDVASFGICHVFLKDWLPLASLGLALRGPSSPPRMPHLAALRGDHQRRGAVLGRAVDPELRAVSERAVRGGSTYG